LKHPLGTKISLIEDAIAVAAGVVSPHTADQIAGRAGAVRYGLDCLREVASVVNELESDGLTANGDGVRNRAIRAVAAG